MRTNPFPFENNQGLVIFRTSIKILFIMNINIHIEETGMARYGQNMEIYKLLVDTSLIEKAVLRPSLHRTMMKIIVSKFRAVLNRKEIFGGIFSEKRSTLICSSFLRMTPAVNKTIQIIRYRASSSAQGNE
jgi:hypothetical protein